MKRILNICLFGLLLLSLSGCADMVEINDRIYVLGIGIDKGEKEPYTLYTFQVSDPNSKEGKGCINVPILSANLTEATRELNRNSAKTVNFEHLSAVVLGEEMAKDGFEKEMNALFMDMSIRRSAALVGCEGKAQTLLQSSIMEGNTARLLDALLLSYDEGITNSFLNSTLHRLYMQFANKLDYYIIKIKLTEGESKEGENEKSQGGQAGNEGKEKSQNGSRQESTQAFASVPMQEEEQLLSFPSPKDLQQPILSIDGVYTYHNNAYAGVLSKRELDTLRMLFADQNSGVISLLTQEKQTTFRILKANTKTSCTLSPDGFMKYKMKVELNCAFSQFPDSPAFLVATDAYITFCEESLSKLLKEEITHLWHLSKDIQKSDFLSLKRLALQDYHAWMLAYEAQWEQIFALSSLEIETKVKIKNPNRL